MDLVLPPRAFPGVEAQWRLSFQRNMRTSNSNGFGLWSLIFAKSGWAGFSSTFHSPGMAAEGTNRAAVLPERTQPSPKRRRDSPARRLHRAGRAEGSRRSVASESERSASIATRSGGRRLGSRCTNVSTAASEREVDVYTTLTPGLFHRPPKRRGASPAHPGAGGGGRGE